MKKKLLISIAMIIIVAIIVQVNFNLFMSAATDFNYVDAFAKSIMYYDESWCGKDAGENGIAWRGACHTTDGADVGLDLTGGFHDAGDHVKFGLPQVYAASTLGWSYYEFKDTFVSKGQDKAMLKVLKHFTDYFFKCYPNETTFHYQVGDGTTDHSYWGPPELQKTSRPTLYSATTAKPASDICGSAAASFALMYLNYKDIDSTYAAKCLAAAKSLYTFAKSNRGLSQSGGFYGSTNDVDEMCWGAVWLKIATGDAAYLTDVTSFLAERNIGGQNQYQNHWTHCWDDVFGGVFVKLAQITDNSFYKQVAEENLSYWIDGVAETAAGEKFINSWGALRYTAAECMMALVYNKTAKNTAYTTFAKEQIDYMLGNNPRNSSYVVGFGNNYPKFPHHRAASGRLEEQPANETKKDAEKHLLYGALVGGPDVNDKYVDDIDEYVHTEVAIDYNAGFVGAMAGMAELYGSGQTPEATPGIEKGPEYYIEGKVMEETNQFVTIDTFIHNNTLLPPKYQNNLSFRYFVDLSEYYNAGMTASDIGVRINYAAGTGGKLSSLKPWDEAKHIYYVEGGWPNTEIYGGVEFQFALTAYNAKIWDSTNDFSRTGLGSTLITAENIPMYVDGVKVAGNEPPKGTGTTTPTATPTTTSTTTKTVNPTTVTGTVTATPTVTPTITSTSTPQGVADYAIGYQVLNSWDTGAQIAVTIKNNSAKDLNGWEVGFAFPGNQKISSLWSATYTQTGADVTVKNLSWNALVPSKGSVSFGFNLTFTGTNSIPKTATLNGTSYTIN